MKNSDNYPEKIIKGEKENDKENGKKKLSRKGKKEKGKWI